MELISYPATVFVGFVVECLFYPGLFFCLLRYICSLSSGVNFGSLARSSVSFTVVILSVSTNHFASVKNCLG